MIEIVNWRTFQHYKDRRPPWIKVHDSLLDCRQWAVLDGDAAKLLIEIWLVAGREGNTGKIDCTLSELAWRLRRDIKTVAKHAKVLQENKFIDVAERDASEVLASGKQSAKPETETETETETEFCAFWNAYPRKIGKKAALRAWKNAKDRPALSVVLSAIERQRLTDGWSKNGGKFIPHPATWLNAGRWDDVVDGDAQDHTEGAI